MWIEALEIAVIVAGVFFMFVAALGVLRLPDFYARIHAPTKAATLGLAFLLVALALHVREETAAAKALLAMLFIGVTAPAGAHILARAAYRRGVRPPPHTASDAYARVARRAAAPDAPDTSRRSEAEPR